MHTERNNNNLVLLSDSLKQKGFYDMIYTWYYK